MNKAMKNVLALSLAVISLVSTAGCNVIVTKTDVSEIEARISMLESALASEKATTSALTEISQLQDEALEALLSANTNLNGKINDLTMANEEFTEKNAELNGKIDDLTMANGALAEKNEELNGKIDDLTTANGVLAEKNEELNGKIDDLIMANEELAEKNQELSESMEQLLAEKEESFAEIEYLKAIYAVSQAPEYMKYIRDEDAEKYGTDLSEYSKYNIQISLRPSYYGMEITKEVLGFENIYKIYDPTRDPDANVDPTQEYAITIDLRVSGTVMAQAAVLYCRRLSFVRNAWMHIPRGDIDAIVPA